MITGKAGVCVGAGQQLARWADQNAVSAIHRPNLRYYVKESDMVVPHSELAMHVGIAGKPIIAWACKGRSCAVVVETPDGCVFTSGLTNEVLTIPHAKAHERNFGFRGIAKKRSRRSRRG